MRKAGVAAILAVTAAIGFSPLAQAKSHHSTRSQSLHAPAVRSWQKASATASPKFEESRLSIYRVKPGDTLITIATRFHTTWQALAQLNHLAHPQSLRVGEVLRVPQAHLTANASLATISRPRPLGQAIVATALRYLGVPYVWGGSTPSGFDCSGLVQYVLAQNGIAIGRTSWAQYAEVTKIPRAELAPGDLVFFSTDGPGASHVGIYIGADPRLGYQQAFVAAPAPGQSVMIQNLDTAYWLASYYGAGSINP